MIAEIRQAMLQDAEAISPLMTQLGYQMTIEELQGRLQSYLDQGDYRAFIALDQNKVIGLITLACFQHFVGPQRACRITALVVDEKYRGKGVWKLLVAAGERFAKDAGCFVKIGRAHV